MTRRANRAGGGTQDANALWVRASELARAGQIREAEKLLVKLAKIAPNNGDILDFHGTLKVQAGKHAQAVPLIKRALRLDDGNSTTHGSLWSRTKVCRNRTKQKPTIFGRSNLIRTRRAYI